MIVASAAPVTPQPSTRIMIGSKIIFTTVPIRFPTIDSLDAPSPRRIFANAVENIINGAPIAIIARYCLAKPIVFTLAPMRCRMVSIPSTDRIATITPSPRDP